MEQSNIGHKLHDIFVRINESDAPSELSVLNGWAKIFYVSEVDQIEKMNAVVETVSLLRKGLKELERLTSTTTRISTDRYKHVLHAMNMALDTINYQSPWAAIKQRFPESSINVIGLIADALPLVPYPIDEEELINLYSSIAEIREEISNFPIEARDLILHYVRSIERAIRHYEIKGEAAFSEMLNESFFYTYQAKDIVEEHIHDEEFKSALTRIVEVWGWVKDRVNDGDTLVKIYIAGDVAGRFILPAVQKLLQ